MTWGNGELNGGVLGALLENCSKSAFVALPDAILRRFGYGGVAPRLAWEARGGCCARIAAMNTVTQQCTTAGAQEAPVREHSVSPEGFASALKPSGKQNAGRNNDMRQQAASEKRPQDTASVFPSADWLRSHAPHPWQPSQFEDVRLRKPESQSKRGVKAHKNVREYTLGEEIANSISHGLGVVLAIVAIPTTIVAAVSHGGGIALAAAIIYSISMLLEYTASTLYHALAHPAAKKVFKVIDHCGIYLFIAGSYTPFCLVTLIDSGGIVLCAVVWALALVGIALEAFWVFRPRWISAVIYLALGWCVVWFLPALVAALPLPGLILLAAGGVSYSIGCIFYVLKKVPYMHTVFHLFVLAASILQYLSVVLYAL